eukprot:CAMPEP_0178717228 /NCGR_PEP_ID=MMETSP0699-20121125/21790_1 /TAXON_ID=265572 /ORGANISM="Extubocellulus spinifer, Strain CCMP396" /LENGTH=343 /DNA_ID=CAMNT_0020367005 /DNA_START=210 /DNA_END=1241 /DNA_ORIENTATION=-
MTSTITTTVLPGGVVCMSLPDVSVRLPDEIVMQHPQYQIKLQECEEEKLRTEEAVKRAEEAMQMYEEAINATVDKMKKMLNQLDDMDATYKSDLSKMKAKHESDFSEMKAKLESDFSEMQSRHDLAMASLRTACNTEIVKLEAERDEEAVAREEAREDASSRSCPGFIQLVSSSSDNDLTSNSSLRLQHHFFTHTNIHVTSIQCISVYGGSVSSEGLTLGNQSLATSAFLSIADGGRSRCDTDDASFFDQSSANLNMEVMHVFAPPGKLGIALDTPDNSGAPIVHYVKEISPIHGRVRAGDRLIAIDDEDVSYLTAVKISKILNRKSNQVTRKLTVLRAMGVA